MPAKGPADAVRGTIVAVGGGEDKIKERHILQKLVQLGGGRSARIAVFPTASSIPRQMAATYDRVFRDLGAQDVEIFDIAGREQAHEAAAERLEGCTLIFLTGGDQLRLVAHLGGTPLAAALRRLNATGVPIAGTSAGAGALCQHMIARGRSGQVMNQRMVSLAPGLGLSNRIVIDQHFSQRHRMGRLFTAVALNPFLVGVGIDEDTAAVLDAKNMLSVWGRGAVTVVDGGRISHSDICDVAPSKAASVLGLCVHVLTPGSTFDLLSRTATGPLPPPDAPPEPS